MDYSTLAVSAAITSLTSGIVGALVATWVSAIKDKKRGHDARDEAMYEGMKLIVMDKAKYLTQAAVDDGEITISQRSFIKSLVDVAHALGANGEMTACAEEVNKLPTKH